MIIAQQTPNLVVKAYIEFTSEVGTHPGMAYTLSHLPHPHHHGFPGGPEVLSLQTEFHPGGQGKTAWSSN